jgi:NodT family efflux transporter outer membrane factor (OMF) lipoprotein
MKAASGNLDVKMAESRIVQARASRDYARAALFPGGNVMGTVSGVGIPDNLLGGEMKLPQNEFNIFAFGFDASWELDLFGGHRREAQSAKAELEAAKFSREDLLISLLAEVARTYVDIRQYQTQLNITRQAIASDKKITAISQQRFELGETAGIDVEKARSSQLHDETQIPYYSNLLAQSEFRMDVLLGENPGVAHKMVNQVSGIPVSDKKLLLAAPASVIAQRPDIRIAEYQLVSATAQQGVAMAKFFPDISLIGFIGLVNTNAANFININSKAWSMGANVLWPILSYGSLSANLHKADAQQQEALTSYQKTIISALSDVERSFTSYIEQEKHTESLEKETAANLKVLTITLGRYQDGLSSYLEVLDAQRKLYSSQIQLALSKAQTSKDLIATYKSLGGSWNTPAVAEIKPKQQAQGFVDKTGQWLHQF